MDLRKVIKNCYLSIRYPFLYPRGIDGLYHSNKLYSIYSKLEKGSTIDISITGKIYNENINKNYKEYRIFDNVIKLDNINNKLIINNFIDRVEFDINKIIYNINKFNVKGFRVEFSLTGKLIIILNISSNNKEDDTNYGFSYNNIILIRNRFKYRLSNIIRYIDRNIIDRIYIIPRYTLYDYIEKGWRERFGKELLEDIRKQLIKDKMLYKWRITQIKEKFGELRIYCNYGSKELYDIISKYENISSNVCIECGKDATHMSKGYILPYCDTCHHEENSLS